MLPVPYTCACYRDEGGDGTVYGTVWDWDGTVWLISVAWYGMGAVRYGMVASSLPPGWSQDGVPLLQSTLLVLGSDDGLLGHACSCA